MPLITVLNRTKDKKCNFIRLMGGNNQSKLVKPTPYNANEQKILEGARYLARKTLKPTSVRKRINVIAQTIILRQ